MSSKQLHIDRFGLCFYRTWQILTINGNRTLMERYMHATVVVGLLRERKRSVYNGTRVVDSVIERYRITLNGA